MDLESSVLESVEDNEEIRNLALSKKSGSTNGESKVHINGSHVVVENNDDGKNDELHNGTIKGKGNEVSGSLLSSSSPVEIKNSLVSPSPKKGSGLRKWRRIKRDERRGDSGGDDSRKPVIQDLPNPVGNPSKRMVRADQKQKSEDSVSSTRAVIKSLNGFVQLGGPSFDAGADSDNSEDRSSKSSTAASAPRKNSTLVKKGRVDTIKKAREEQVKIKKENSYSSLESDSRSSNFLFTPGTCATSNGVRSDGAIDSDGDNGDDGGRGRDDVVADSSSVVKEERSQNHDSYADQDPLVESMFALQSAQEALEKEVLNFKEINIDDDSVSVESVLTQNVQFDVADTTKGDVETELEALYKHKIETEVEYLAISEMVQKLRVTAMDQITLLEEQKAEQILSKLSDTENKAAVLEKEAEKLETFCEEIASKDETMKLQKRICKYTSYFFLQLLCLVLILGVLAFQKSPHYVEVVPT